MSTTPAHYIHSLTNHYCVLEHAIIALVALNSAAIQCKKAAEAFGHSCRSRDIDVLPASATVSYNHRLALDMIDYINTPNRCKSLMA